MNIWVLLTAIVFTLGWNFLANVFQACLSWLAGKSFKLRKRPLTYIVGSFEIVATAIVVNFYLSQDDLISRQKLGSIAAFIGGWFAIKAFSHDLRQEQKTQNLTPTEIYYKFILGTIFSLAGGVILGMIIHFEMS